MTHPHSNRNVVPTVVLTRSRLVSLNAARPVPTAVTQSTLKSTWPVKHVVNKAHLPGNLQQALKDRGVIDSGCLRHMTRNISFLLEFKEIDGGYVAFRGIPKAVTAASTRPKAKGLVIQKEEQEPTPLVSSQQPSHIKIQDKGKGIVVEPEPVEKLSKKDSRVSGGRGAAASANRVFGPRINHGAIRNSGGRDTSSQTLVESKALVMPTEAVSSTKTNSPLSYKVILVFNKNDVASIRRAPYEVRKRLLNLILAAFHQSPEFVVILKVKAWLESEKDIQLGDWKAANIEILHVFNYSLPNWFFITELVKESSKKAEAEITQEVNAARHFITAVSYELMLFGLMKVAVVNLMLLDASDGFDQIVDFLNVHTIKYALVVNPTIYVLCIKKFWATAIVKKVNDDVQLRTLINGKKVVVLESIIRRDVYLDDADRVECLPNAEIFEKLARMGYEKPHPKLTLYKAFFFAQWKFLIHTLVYMVRNVDSPSKFLMYPRFLQVVLDHQVDDMTTHNTRYTSLTLTQKVFANMKRVGKGVEIPIAPTPPSTTSAPSPTDLQDPIPTPHATLPQDQPPIPHDSSPQDQPTTPHESSMPLLTTLMETSEEKTKEARKEKMSKTLGLKRLRMVGVAQRVESSTDTVLVAQEDASKRGGKIAAIDAGEDITLVDVETDEEEVAMDAEFQERLNQKDVNAASKGVSAVSAPELVSAAESMLFDDEYVTMTMAQTMIKLKAEKAKILDEQIAQKLHDEEVQKAAARDKQERADMERALELQR
uniref:Xylulose kinase-1 n=1 Tax=Tanacetum cinerariifolium TaxID=118510 RepID=A0A6L2LGN9_TANCI|nr:hypothetical protein [Tanacetum cinerariifolium]